MIIFWIIFKFLDTNLDISSGVCSGVRSETFKIFKDTNLDISSGVHSDVRSEIFKIFKEMIFEVSSGVSPGFFNRYKIYCVQRTKQARAIKTFKFKILVNFEILYNFLDIDLDISTGVHSDVCSEIFKILKIFKEIISTKNISKTIH